MLNNGHVQAILAPFLPEALSVDTSRGFKLTSKAASVIERLNEAFGTCGISWRYDEEHHPWQEVGSITARSRRGGVPPARLN